MTQLSHNNIALEVSPHGAEITSIQMGGHEYLWQADPQFWKRHSPILFPIVGKVWENTYRVAGKVFHLPQHGFARDSVFNLIDQQEHRASWQLTDSDATLAAYPYRFRLTAEHQVVDGMVTCRWTVKNTADEPMFFQIGAHPAFKLRDFDPEAPIYGHLLFFRNGQQLQQLSVTHLSAKGHALAERQALPLTDGRLAITPTLFEHDALVLEDSQADRVVLCDKCGSPYLEMTFDAPVLGIWSPKKAPFCCIEPWFGRTDAEGYCGDIAGRDHIQHLAPRSTFEFKYTIKPLL